jgi:hypothetical protein
VASAEWIVGSLLGAGAIGYWLRTIRGHWRYTKSMTDTERSIREARANAEAVSPYRSRAEDETAVLDYLRATDATCETLRRLDFRVLGDLVIAWPGRAPSGAARILVDGSGTMLAILMVMLDRLGVVTRLTSYSDHGVFTTWLGSRPTLATPPFVKRQESSGSLEEAIAKHRSFIEEGLHRVSSLEDAIREAAEAHDKARRWRAEQPPDDLLDADLRAILGKHYERRGKIWARKLRDRLPEATLRRS